MINALVEFGQIALEVGLQMLWLFILLVWLAFMYLVVRALIIHGMQYAMLTARTAKKRLVWRKRIRTFRDYF